VILIVLLLGAELIAIANFTKLDADDVMPAQEALQDCFKMDNEQINQLEGQSNRYTHVFEQREGNGLLTLDGYTKVLGNEHIEVWIDEEDCDVRIVNAVTGYVWGGIEKDKAEDLNTRWTNLARSLITINYLDSQLAEKTVYFAEDGVDRNYYVDKDQVHFAGKWSSIGLSLEFSLALEEDAIVLSLKDSSIVEDEKFPITSISFLPFFGAARLDEINGYFFLPDGSGALMRFRQGTDYISSYAQRIYGSDMGVENTALMNNISDVEIRPKEFMIKQPSVLMPIFGVVHGVDENAFMVEVENGQEYASILADAASSNVNYHYVRTQFTYRECYIQPTAKNGSGVRTVRKDKNEINPSEKYYFLEEQDANYVGMARCYRDNLKERGELLDQIEKESNVPMQLNVIASVRNKGYMGNNSILASTASGVTAMAEELNEENVNNIVFCIEGWLKDGYGAYNLKNQRLEKEFADLGELKNLNCVIDGFGDHMVLNFDAMRMTEEQYRLKTNIATMISQQQVKSSVDNKGVLFSDTYYRRNKLSADYTDKMCEWLSVNGLAGSVAGVGELLYSDYLKGEEVSRREAVLMQKELASKMNENNSVRGYQTPNSYIWNYVSEAFGMPMCASQYLYFTDTVPFLQIVLHGSVNCYGDFLNRGTYSRENILRLIEYGQYPAFMITEVNNYKLKDSALYDIYSTEYSNWKSTITETYREINEALKEVIHAQIIDHEVLEEGLVRVTYDNGYSVIVNYTLENKMVDGVTVKGMGWQTVMCNGLKME